MFDYLAHSHPSPELVYDVQDLFLIIISIQKKEPREKNARQKERNEKEQRKILEPQQ